jgi:hypothetical protein
MTGGCQLNFAAREPSSSDTNVWAFLLLVEPNRVEECQVDLGKSGGADALIHAKLMHECGEF